MLCASHAKSLLRNLKNEQKRVKVIFQPTLQSRLSGGKTFDSRYLLFNLQDGAESAHLFL